MKKVAIIGSHGLYANYGGWDQLVRNLAERKSDEIEYLIFNSSDSPDITTIPPGVKVRKLKLKASGFEGLFYDFWSILICFWKVDTYLLLGVQGIPLLVILKLFKRKRIVSNVGGIEWERPKFSYFSKVYLKICFRLSFQFSNSVILDNKHYEKFVPENPHANFSVIPYGGEIDTSLNVTEKLLTKYPFLNSSFCLSISRSLEDNLLYDLCESFVGSHHTLVLISNFTNSVYGNEVYKRFSNVDNIILINGLYIKPELDLIRRKCKVYIHTHTLCGTAPSLVEMIISRRPIISIDNPQNRFTLYNQAFFFSSFVDIQKVLNEKSNLDEFIASDEICSIYSWDKIVDEYELNY